MLEKILIIDNAASTPELQRILMGRYGYDVTTALTAEDGLREAYRTQPDLILLDLLPDMDGWDVCRRLRDLSDVPIIFLTAYGDKRDVVKGLELGADDYILKPFDTTELIARIKALTRRLSPSSGIEELILDQGKFKINFEKRELQIANVPVHLSPKEFDLLGVLVRNTGRIVTNLHLTKEAWGSEYNDTPKRVKMYVHHLRLKIEKDPAHPKYILTSHRIGYRFEAN